MQVFARESSSPLALSAVKGAFICQNLLLLFVHVKTSCSYGGRGRELLALMQKPTGPSKTHKSNTWGPRALVNKEIPPCARARPSHVPASSLGIREAVQLPSFWTQDVHGDLMGELNPKRLLQSLHQSCDSYPRALSVNSHFKGSCLSYILRSF